MRKYIVATAVLAMINLVSVIIFLNLYTKLTGLHIIHDGIAYAALPNDDQVLGTAIVTEDSRVENLKQFFAKYHSILAVYAQDFVNAADLYGIDYRLAPGIAMTESGGCTAIPKDSFNCWGFGVYGGNAKKFTNYPEAIDIVTRALARYYVTKGLDTPDKIMPYWAPASRGTWAPSVNHYITQM